MVNEATDSKFIPLDVVTASIQDLWTGGRALVDDLTQYLFIEKALLAKGTFLSLK